MAQKIERDYAGTDNYLLELADTFALDLDNSIDDFTAFDSTMGADWLSDFKAATTSALTQDSDDIIVAIQQQKTDLVKEAMAKGQEVYNDTMYFAKKAFPKDQSKLKEFGMGEKYNRALHSQSAMVDFLEELFRTATKYQTPLLAAGTNAAKIASIETVCNNLRNLNAEQNLYILGRPVISEERIKKLNLVYAYIRQTCDAAPSVYKNSYARQTEFTFNPPVHEDGFTAQQFFVPANSVKKVVEIPYLDTRIIQAQNRSTTPINIGLSTDGTTLTGSPATIPAQDKIETTGSALAAAGNFILLQNTSAEIIEVRVRWQDGE